MKRKIVPNAPIPRILNFVTLKIMDYEDEKLIEFFELYDI